MINKKICIKKPEVKICCISSVEEAEIAVNSGASAIGLVSAMPSGPGVISEEIIIEIVKKIPEEIKTFLLTSEIHAEKIIKQVKKCGTNTVQLVDEIEMDEYSKIRNEMPEVQIVQVVHVTDESSVEYALKVSEYANAILLDSGNPLLKTKILGGTGKTHNWEISKKIREAVKIPLYLAGGLNAENVKEAIETVQPYGVDLCSGVRTDGKLDTQKVENFFSQINLF